MGEFRRARAQYCHCAAHSAALCHFLQIFAKIGSSVVVKPHHNKMAEHPSQNICGICRGNHLTDEHSSSKDPGLLKASETLKTQEKKELLDYDRLASEIEKSPLLGQGLLEMIAGERLRQLKRFNLPPDTKDGAIAVACDQELLAQLKGNLSSADSDIIDKYHRSSVGEPLDFLDRQAVVNIIINPNNRIYKNKEGLDVNLSEYLKDYYAPLGVDIDISFDTLTPAQSRAIDRFFRIAQRNFSAQHLEQESIAIPFIQIKKGNRTVSIPVIGSDKDIHAPMRDPETHEKIGSFVGLKIVHEPKLGSGLSANIGFMVHELDHAIRKVLDGDEKKIDEEDRIISEGTAEFARHLFSEIQNQFNPDLGYGLNNALMLASSIASEGTEAKPGLKHTYASGLVLSERVNSTLGKEKFFEFGYDPGKSPDGGQLSELRRQIVSNLEKVKGLAREFMVNF